MMIIVIACATIQSCKRIDCWRAERNTTEPKETNQHRDEFMMENVSGESNKPDQRIVFLFFDWMLFHAALQSNRIAQETVSIIFQPFSINFMNSYDRNSCKLACVHDHMMCGQWRKQLRLVQIRICISCRSAALSPFSLCFTLRSNEFLRMIFLFN